MTKRVSDQVADWLVEHGVDQVFSVTGGGAMFLNHALGDHKGLNCLFMHHEQACAMAAEGYARVTNKPAVVMVTTGPGAINAMNGVFGAYTDSIPMIVISGQVKRETCLDFHDLPNLRQLGDQEGPTISMAKSICKYAQLIRDPSDLETVLPLAFQLATTGRPGPVWLDIPLDIQSDTRELVFSSLSIQPESTTSYLLDHCQTIIQRLKKAHRPLIMGGTGVRLSGTSQRVLKIVENIGVPMVTAWTHDLIPSDHPLFAGRPGTIGTRPGNFCVQNCDFLLVLGSRLNIRQTSYNLESFAKNAWVSQVDVDAAELSKPTYQPDLGVESDLSDFLDCLEIELQKHEMPKYEDWAKWCKDIQSEFDVRNEHKQGSELMLNPYVVVSKIFEQLRDDDIVVCGNASACILPFQLAYLRAQQRLFSNSGSASMGYDLPAAIGAAAACKKSQQRVICFAGDGSLMMNIQELQTLFMSGLKIIIIVINNAGYLSIRQTHENFFGKIVGATPESGVGFPNFSAVAKAFSIQTATILNSQDIKNLNSYLDTDGPLLIDIKVDSTQNFSPRVKSRVDEKGKFITPELDDMFPFLADKVVARVRNSASKIQSKKINK
jgi:acetolactate synthase-1/2/3 large subunit